MSTDQSQTTASSPSEPKLCKKGCGFFGSSAFGDCCSKCFIEMQKKQGIVQASMQPQLAAVAEEPKQPEPSAETQPMEVDEPVVLEAPVVEPVPAAADGQTKKKKKTSYKNMLKDMMKSSPDRDIEKEKEQLRQVTGGGQFQKIEKI
ncbi:hypothetical protein MPSEU_000357900 [Mayamaea pseudoterrestris]|nr:hypothetical protein MPSEU_000357900 [Mayamaea pseudoterrestris]